MACRMFRCTVAILALAGSSLPAADYFRLPPPPEVYSEILSNPATTREVDSLLNRIRDTKTIEPGTYDFVRKVRSAITILALTDRRVDAEFAANRLRAALDASRPRNLHELSEWHALRGFLYFSTGLRLRGEKELVLSNGYINRVLPRGIRKTARTACFLGGVLKSLDYKLHGDILDDHAEATLHTIRRRHGGTRKIRGYPPRRILLPAMTPLSLREWLVQIGEATRALEATQPWLPKVRMSSSRANLPESEYNNLENNILPLVDQLCSARAMMKKFLFELRRSSDKEVKQVKEDNYEDFQDMRQELRARSEELMSHLLMARLRNGF